MIRVPATSPMVGMAGPTTAGQRASLYQLHDLTVGGAGLGAVLADLLEQGPVGAEIDHRVAGATVDVPSPQEIRDHEEVVGLPIEPMAGDLGRAFAVAHDVEGVGGLALPAGRLARPQQLRAVVECREYRGTGRRIREAQ